MDKLRDFLQSWPGRIMLMLCLSPVVLMGFENLFRGSRLAPNELVKIDNTSITSESVQNEANATRSQLLSRGVDGGLINDNALHAQTFDNLLNRTLLEVHAKQLGMYISDKMVSQLLQQDPQFLDANGKFSNDLFAQFLTHNRMTKDVLFANYRNQFNIRQLSTAILSGIFPDTQVSRLIDLQTKSRPIWIKRLPWQNFQASVTLTDADITAYYNKHKDTLVTPAIVDLVYLDLNQNTLPQIQISDEELKVAYQDYIKNNQLDTKSLAQILLTGDDAQTKAKEIADELNSGKDFAELAKTYSEDPSGQTGGEIGRFNPAVFGEDANKVSQAIAMLDVGQVSPPIQTAFGWQIFKVVKAEQAPSFEQLKEQLTKTLNNSKQKAELDKLISTINNMAVDGYALSDIANELKLSTTTLKDYPKTGNTTALNQAIFIKTAFDESLLSTQAVSSNLEVDGRSLWLQPTNYRPSTPMTLEQAKPKIVATLTQQKASQLALQQAQADIANFSKAQIGQFQSLGNINQQSQSINDQERISLFDKPATKDNLVAWTVLTDEGASILVGGNISTQATARMNPEERQLAKTMMKEVAGQDYLEDYLLYLKSSLALQTNEEAVKALLGQQAEK